MKNNNSANNPFDSNRNSLFGEPNARNNNSSRSWGKAPPKETPLTENLDNKGLLTQQQVIMDEQDQILDVLSGSVGRQLQIAKSIDAEVSEQNLLLDDMHDKVDRTDSRLRAVKLKLHDVSEKASVKGLWACICFLILTLIVIIFLAFYIR
eukprot:TRINITY_DN6484_c0_g1_i1.p1 TRINITY_DN6484_c0_g1~~TRINITY_DN6484_c0_g1_i1.p1  ORF type:complete len:151 (+),score=37.61 TRINITY_DN6484_c0_g1_i1:190-642(+)